MRDAARLHDDAPGPLSYAVTRVEGSLPAGLRGSMLRVGPGPQHLGGRGLNPLDAYGYVAGLSFDGGHAHFRSRIVEGPTFKSESQSGKQLVRRAFTNKPRRWSNAFDLKLANLANHDVYSWGGALVCTDQPGHTLLDAATLATVGPSPFDAHKPGSLGALTFMPRPDPSNGRLVGFTTRPSLAGDVITFVELDSSWRVVAQTAYPTGQRGLLVHDTAFTKNWYLTPETGCLDVMAAMWGERTVWDCIEPREGGRRRVFFAPRGHSGTAFFARLPEGMMAFHVVNAFDHNDTIVVDLVAYPERVDLGNAHHPDNPSRGAVSPLPKPSVVRCVVKPGDGELEPMALSNVAVESPCINPAFHGLKHRYAYGAALTVRGDEDLEAAYFYFHGVAAIDCDGGQTKTWSAGTRQFCAPPVFAAKPGSTGESDGWLLTWVFDADAGLTKAVVLEASDIARGPIATLWLEHALPLVSHAEFSPTVLKA